MTDVVMSKNAYRIEYEQSCLAAGAAVAVAVIAGMERDVANDCYLRTERLANAVYLAKCKAGMSGRFALAAALEQHDGLPSKNALQRADAIIRGKS